MPAVGHSNTESQDGGQSSSYTRKTVRIRDPIHDLIVFNENSELDQLALRLLATPEFQRLRRIKQLGFSEFTYPGASHSRLAHSVGVFHTARKLADLIETRTGHANLDRRTVSLCAALLHDIGHGPFSHVFEGALKALGRRRKHEATTAELIEGDTSVNAVLRDFDSTLPERVASVIKAEDPEDVFASIVSSQFDADRMDYLLRDRYMCGVSVGFFDYSWILENLIPAEVVRYADPERNVGDMVEWMVLHPKAREAAEGYLLARFQLYSTVYYHKTTRSTEGMLRIVLTKLAKLARDGSMSQTGTRKANPVVRFLTTANPAVDDLLAIDDSSMWSLLQECASAKDRTLSMVSQGIRERRLFKAFDNSARTDASSDRGETFVFGLKEQLARLGLVDGETFFEDRPRAKGYDWYEWDAPSALKKVMVRDIERNENIDIAERSDVVRALRARSFLRVYAPDSESVNRIEGLWRRG